MGSKAAELVGGVKFACKVEQMLSLPAKSGMGIIIVVRIQDTFFTLEFATSIVQLALKVYLKKTFVLQKLG